MTSLKRSLLSVALYLAVILILGEMDYLNKPIINFAAYFYLVVMVAVPVTLFFPSISKVSVNVPLLVWAGIYLFILQYFDRTKSTTSIEFSIIGLEFVLLGVGVLLVHQLAVQLSHAESLMDALAFGAFPNRIKDIEAESQRIKVELTRSRRYQRPLSLVMMKIEPEADVPTVPTIKGIQTDLMGRFTFARVGQIIDDLIRQTDLFLRDRRGRYIILCPETNFSKVELFARRVSQVIVDKTGLRVMWGIASFPEEALTFEDLLQKARERLLDGGTFTDNKVLKSSIKEVAK